jgi:hypothetical protein
MCPADVTVRNSTQYEAYLRGFALQSTARSLGLQGLRLPVLPVRVNILLFSADQVNAFSQRLPASGKG